MEGGGVDIATQATSLGARIATLVPETLQHLNPADVNRSPKPPSPKTMSALSSETLRRQNAS